MLFLLFLLLQMIWGPHVAAGLSIPPMLLIPVISTRGHSIQQGKYAIYRTRIPPEKINLNAIKVLDHLMETSLLLCKTWKLKISKSNTYFFSQLQAHLDFPGKVPPDHSISTIFIM